MYLSEEWTPDKTGWLDRPPKPGENPIYDRFGAHEERLRQQDAEMQWAVEHADELEAEWDRKMAVAE